MASDEDIFASLGGSLMSDLLSDINAIQPGASQSQRQQGGQGDQHGAGQPSGGGAPDDGGDVLASLERELADLTAVDGGSLGGGGSGVGGGAAAGGPPGIMSAASLVVAHGAERSTRYAAAGGGGAPPPPPPPPPPQPQPPRPAAAVAASSGATAGAAKGGGGDDAWALSLAKFSSLQGLADDFLAADSAKKQQKAGDGSRSASQTRGGVDLQNELSSAQVDELFVDDDGYDVEEKVTLGSMPQMQQQQQQQQQQRQPPAQPRPPAPAQPQMQQQQRPPQQKQQRPPQQQQGMPPPPQFMGQQQQQPQQQQMGMGMPPPQMQGGMPPAGGGPMPPPPSVQQQQQMMMAQQQHQQQHQQQQQQQHQQQMMMAQQQIMAARQAAYVRHVEQQEAVAAAAAAARQQEQQQKQQQQQMAAAQQQDEEVSRFKKKDFPALGAVVGKDKDQEESKMEDKEEESKEQEDKIAQEDGDEPLIAVPKRPSHDKPTGGITGVQIMQRPGDEPRVSARLLFCNPTPTAPPINANNVRSYFMTPRDLCYVVHSMMRPLISLDAYNDDYYRWGYDDRRSRNLLMLGGATPAGNNLPNPVWKETKVKAQEIEDKFRTSVEKRAEKWADKKQTLGRTVKVNVKRPKALLATTGALSTALSNKAEEGREEGEPQRSEDDQQRLKMWTARLAIDKGYVAYLDLLETRRLLQSQAGPTSEAVAQRRAELTRDVEDNVAKLHSSLGVAVTKAEDGSRTIEVDGAALGRTLGMPKGRMLLSRVLDEGVLPHSSACRVLPKALGIILATPSVAGGAPPRGEDRLVRSLTGLVQTAQPSLAPEDLIDCLVEFVSVHASITGGDSTKSGDATRSMLGGQRARMELLHAVLSRGGAVCVEGTEFGAPWKAKEAEFMAMLSTMAG